MSRSNPTLTNPADRFMEWRGGTGTMEWYDKEKEQSFQVKLPFEFMVLDQLGTITGFSEQDGSRYWSNEVRSIGKEEVTVRTKRGVKDSGIWREMKGHPMLTGARYATSIYIAYMGDDKQYHIGNIKAYGAALSAWIEFAKKHKVDNGKVVLSGSTEAKKGATVYQIPTFEYQACSPDENDIAVAMDQDLQNYLTKYMHMIENARYAQDGLSPDEIAQAELEAEENERRANAAAAEAASVGSTPEQRADYERRRAAGPVPTKQVDDVVIEDIGDEPINLDDIPF